MKLDSIDLQIIETLQLMGRTHRTVLAAKTGLSLPSVSERLKKLEERGLIAGYHARLNAKEIGLDVTAFVMVMIAPSSRYPSFLKHAQSEPEILECHAITGEGSYLLKVRTQNTGTLEQLLSRIQSWQGVHATRTNVVLSTPKETTVISLAHLQRQYIHRQPRKDHRCRT